MKQNLLIDRYYRLSVLYRKLKFRFDKALKENRFKNYSLHKQRQLLSRLEKLKARLADLEKVLKLSGSALALGLMLSGGEAQAQAATPIGNEFQVNTYTTGSQGNSQIAMDQNGNFVVVWTAGDSQDGDDDGIFAQLYNASGTPQGMEFQVNTYTTGNQYYPSVAMDSDGDFVIAWTSYGQDGEYDGVYAQRYNAAGVAQGTEFPVNTHTTSLQRNPSVAMDANGNFVIAWQSRYQDGDLWGIYAQRYDASGAAQGGEFLVNTYTTGYQRNPSAAMDADGDFVIVWTSVGGQDGSGYGVYAQRYDAAGTTQGGEFLVNSHTTGHQSHPSLAMDPNGNFVIAWNAYDHQDGSIWGIFAQRYNASGVEQGGEFQVNTYTTGTQAYPAVVIDPNGNFMITWNSYGQDGSYEGVYAQRYAADGTALAGEFPVNTHTIDEQSFPIAAMDSEGNFVVVWNSYYQDGNYNGVYARHYINNALPAINDQVFSIDENSSGGSSVGTVVASDPNVGQTLSYSITAGNTGNVFAINSATGVITVAGTLDYETASSYSLTVEVTDDGTTPLSSSATITIDINNVNEIPIDIILSASSVDENVAANTTVGTLTTTDPDAGNTFTYTLVSGTGDTDNASFNISGDELRITSSPDFETQNSYSIRVQTEDQGGFTFEKAFTITVNDVTETGVAKAYANSQVNIYPNPSAGQFSINPGGLSLDGSTVRILNAMGETVYTGSFTEQLDLQQLTKGVYTLMLENEKSIIVKQIVIQ